MVIVYDNFETFLMYFVAFVQIMIQAIEMGIFDELETSPKPLTARALANKKDFNLVMTEKLLNSLSTIGLTRKIRGKDGNTL